MSNRTLIEINHDFAGHLGDDQFVRCLKRYLSSASRENAEALEGFGIKVLGIRHHSGQYYVEREPDGFPVVVYPRREAERGR